GGPGFPAGWLFCDGSAVSRTTFAALFSAIGTYWGAGDSITTFNLPDMRGRTPIGYVNTAAPGITARTFGSRGGEEAHTLSVAEMANHGHGVNDPPHSHIMNFHHHTYSNPTGTSIGVQGGANQIFYPSGQANTSDTQDSMFAAPTGVSVQNNGGNAAHNVMQPFAVCYFIIKT